jgi:DNA-binding NarL/FixJ family response regulator
VVVVDLDLEEQSAVDAVRTIANTMPATRVLVLSERSEHRDVLEAVKAGAAGYLIKTASPAELVDAVRRTAEGDAVFTPGLADLVLAEYQRLARQHAQPVSAPALSVVGLQGSARPVSGLPVAGPVPSAVPRLTERETEVLQLVSDGLTSKQVAARLGLSHRTVENHVQATMRKLQLHNRIELVRYAISQGLAE